MPSTLVTGANSFVAAHVINSLISAGHHVTGTVRRAKLADDIFALHPEWKHHLDIELVADLADQPRWEGLFKAHSFHHIVHVAAPQVDTAPPTDYETHFLRPNVLGNLALLRAAHARGSPTLKSIAVTGSLNAAVGSRAELLAGAVTAATWTSVSPEQARSDALRTNPHTSYCSGKKEGELAIWAFVEQSRPAFAVTVFLPALIFGPPIEPLKDKGGSSSGSSSGISSLREGLNYSAGVVYSLMDGTTHDSVPPTGFPSYIDVRDLAEAHVRALTEPRVAGKRLLIGGRRLTYSGIVRVMKGLELLRGRKLPEESGEDENVPEARIDADEANEVLMGGEGGFRSFEETIRDTVVRLVELERERGL